MSYLLNIASNKRRLDDLEVMKRRRKYIQARLKELGIGTVELLRSEVNYLPYILHTDEKIGAFVSGKSAPGHILIVATDRRVIVLDCKPLFNNVEDIAYDAVAGVSVGSVGPFSTIKLSTRIGDFSLKTSNTQAIGTFKQFIDSRCIENGRLERYL